MLTTDDVFVTGVVPEATYVDRSEQGLEDAVSRYLRVGGTVLAISGPSKSGKSTLINRVFRRKKQPYIRVTGASIKSMTDFWSIIAHRASLPSSIEETTEKGDAFEASVTASAGGGIVPSSVSAAFKQQLTSRGATTTSPTIILSESVKDALRGSGIALVVDDFHYAPEDVRKEIARELKDLVFNKARVVLIAIPERVMEILQSEGELGGRVKRVIVQEWAPLELMRIATQGFSALNVVDPSRGALAEVLVRESYSSPLLMQILCNKLCEHNLVYQEVDTSVELAAPNWDLFFSALAVDMQPSIVEHLALGPVQRRRRAQRDLKGGGTVDMYSGTLMALNKLKPERRATPLQLSDAMNAFLSTRPQLETIRRTCRQMAGIANDRSGSGDAAIDYKDSPERLTIVDPYLAFFISWGLRQLSLPV